MKIYTVFLVFWIVRYCFMQNVFELYKDENEVYRIIALIGTPKQRFSLVITFFSEVFELFCDINNVLFNDNMFTYYSKYSNTSQLFLNSNKNFVDILTFERSSVSIKNFTINCVAIETISNNIGILGITNQLFYSQEYPYLFICLHNKGGYIQQTDLMAQALIIKLQNSNVFFRRDFKNENKWIVLVKNLALKIYGIVNLMEDTDEFNISFTGTINYNLFSSVIYKKIKEILLNATFYDFERFSNDETCFLIEDFEKVKSKLPILVFVIDSLSSFEIKPEDYLILYQDQHMCCFNFKENKVTNENLITMISFKKQLIITDFTNNLMKIIDFDCENNNLKQFFDGNINVKTNNINETFINLVISLSCLIIFLLLIYFSFKIKDYCNGRKKRKNQLIGQNKMKQKKNEKKIHETLEMEAVKIEIIEKEIIKKKNKHKKSKYSLEEEEEKSQDKVEIEYEEIKKDENPTNFAPLNDFKVSKQSKKSKIKDKILETKKTNKVSFQKRKK